MESELPKVYGVNVGYDGPLDNKKRLTSYYMLDFRFHFGMEMAPKDMPDLVKTLEDIKKEMQAWTDGISGIRANVVDRDKEERQRYRRYRLRRAKSLRDSQGLWASAKSLVNR